MLRKRDLLATTVATFTSGLIAATAILGSSAAAAETFPERPIRLLVPYAAGGGTDAIARLIAQGVSERLGQQLLVENNNSQQDGDDRRYECY